MLLREFSSEIGRGSFFLSRLLHRLSGRPPEDWRAAPEAKRIERRSRKRLADTLRLAKMSAPWKTLAQLKRLEDAPRRDGDTFSFAVLGDAEPGRFWIARKMFNVPGAFERQLREIQGRDVDFSIQLGDMVSRGTVPNYLAFLRSLEAWSVRHPYLSVIGNHDRRFPHGQTDSQLYRATFGKTNYYFDRGPARFVVLDTSLRRLSPLQALWLDRVLDTPRLKVIATHFPPAQLRCWTAYAGAKALASFERGAAEFVRIASRRRVNRVYIGHIHAFGVQDYDGVRYVLTGGGGSPLFPSGVVDRCHHYLVVTVGPRLIREVVYGLDGRATPIPPGKILLKNV